MQMRYAYFLLTRAGCSQPQGRDFACVVLLPLAPSFLELPRYPVLFSPSQQSLFELAFRLFSLSIQADQYKQLTWVQIRV